MRERPDHLDGVPRSRITFHASRFTIIRKSRFTSHRITVTFWPETNLNVMQKPASFLGAVLLVGLLASGCAGPEKKFGRGMNNMFEIVRMGDMRRTVEQTALFESSETAYGT